MTMNSKRAIFCTAFCAALLAFGCNANATSLTIGDSHELGFVSFGIPTGDADITAYVNAMIGLSPGGSTIVTESGIHNTVTRSLNIFSPLDPAVLISRISYTSPGATV